MKSDFLKLNIIDLARGAVVATGAAILAAIVPILETGSIPGVSTLKGIAVTGLAAGGAYLLKNLFTNSKDQLVRGETVNG
ncbi:MAG: hypothetical protein CVU71_01080 [Deltaproteobacteria bacterium HGW-Deltaproteobacteria-6]|jgi:hypothetical protein|nr:MAG: hypothetical protein CVU71_01080 [Deltaproteobacteria bacterium HGW-Deltaproteobacteria-6]